MQICAKLRTKIHGVIQTATKLEVKIMDAVLKEQKTKEDMKAGIESVNSGRLTLIFMYRSHLHFD